MPITDQMVQQVAELAKLRLSEGELARYTHQLDAILEYFELLDQLDTVEEQGTAHVLALPCPLRDDQEASDSTDQEAILDQAPQREQDYFLVPKILDE